MASSLVDNTTGKKIYPSGYLSPAEDVELSRIIKDTVANVQVNHSEKNPKMHFDIINVTVKKIVADHFKDRLDDLSTRISNIIKFYLKKLKPTHAIEYNKSLETATLNSKSRNVTKITYDADYFRLKLEKEMEEKDMNEALSLSIDQIEYEKRLNETLAKSFEEEKSKLLTLLIANDVDFDVLANQLNKIWSGGDIVVHKGETMYDRSALILAVIEIFGHDSTIISTKHIKNHITAIREYCLAIDSDATYQKDYHQKDRNSTFNIYSINDYLVNIQIKGDGNCLWSSVSHSLIGDYAMMKSLRLLTAASLLHFSEKFSETLNSQTSRFNYRHVLTLDQLVKDSVSLQLWGDEFHIMALSLALKRPIYSYGSLNNIPESAIMSYEQFRQVYEVEQFPNHFKYIGDASDANKEPILLHYDGNSHYSAVLKRSRSVKPLMPFMQIIDAFIKPRNFEISKPGKANETVHDNYTVIDPEIMVERMGNCSSVEDHFGQNEIAKVNMMIENGQVLQQYKTFFENVKEIVNSRTNDWKSLQGLVKDMENRLEN